MGAGQRTVTCVGASDMATIGQVAERFARQAVALRDGAPMPRQLSSRHSVTRDGDYRHHDTLLACVLTGGHIVIGDYPSVSSRNHIRHICYALARRLVNYVQVGISGAMLREMEYIERSLRQQVRQASDAAMRITWHGSLEWYTHCIERANASLEQLGLAPEPHRLDEARERHTRLQHSPAALRWRAKQAGAGSVLEGLSHV